MLGSVHQPATIRQLCLTLQRDATQRQEMLTPNVNGSKSSSTICKKVFLSLYTLTDSSTEFTCMLCKVDQGYGLKDNECWDRMMDSTL